MIRVTGSRIHQSRIEGCHLREVSYKKTEPDMRKFQRATTIMKPQLKMMNPGINYNRRSFPRQNLKFPLHVHCRATRREFGQILDLSLEGIRMLCITPVKRGETWELSLRMPRGEHGDELAVFEGRSIWTCPSHLPDRCLAGFKVVSFWHNSNQHVTLSSAVHDYQQYLASL